MAKFGKISLSLATAITFLSFSGCGGGGGTNAVPPTESTSITIVDPYISGATVFWDKDNDGVLDSGEPESTPSDSSGKATFNVAIPEGARIIMNTKGTHNGEAYTGTLTANYSTTGVVSPLTTLEEKGYTKTEIVNLLAAAGITLTEADITADPMAGLSSSNTTATDTDLAKIQATVAINTFLEMKNMFDVTKTKTDIAAVTTDLTTVATLMKETITVSNVASSNADVMIKAAVAMGSYVVSNPTDLATINTNKTTIINNLKTNIVDNPTLQVKLSNATGFIDLKPTATSGFTSGAINGKKFYMVVNWGTDGYVRTDDTFETNATLTHANTPDGNFTESWSLQDGKIEVTTDEGKFTWTIVSTTADYIKVDSNDSDGINSGYMYFDESKANIKAKLNSISVQNGFGAEWLNGRTLYTVDGSDTYSFVFNNGYTILKDSTGNTITDANGKVYNLPYTITSEGIIKVDESGIQWDGEGTARLSGTYEYYRILGINGDEILLADGENLDTVKSASSSTQSFFTTIPQN